MITYVRGDATNPKITGPTLIIHIVNDLGKWGKGFVLAVSKKWPQPERCYRAWHAGRCADVKTVGERVLTTGPCKLGHVQLVEVSPDLFVINMVAQHGIGMQEDGPPIRYEALAKCLEKVSALSNMLQASVHGPRFGTGLAGGTWEEIEPLLSESLAGPVYIYDYDSN